MLPRRPGLVLVHQAGRADEDDCHHRGESAGVADDVLQDWSSTWRSIYHKGRLKSRLSVSTTSGAADSTGNGRYLRSADGGYDRKRPSAWRARTPAAPNVVNGLRAIPRRAGSIDPSAIRNDPRPSPRSAHRIFQRAVGSWRSFRCRTSLR
jgi:hypothetical protein